MSELSVRQDLHNDGSGLTLGYDKREADKVIAELKETLKNSRNARKYWRKEYLIEYKECLHQKYKRCLAMAQEWRNYASFCGMQSSCHNHRGFGKTAKKYTWKETHAWKCVKRWLKIAEKFKEEN